MESFILYLETSGGLLLALGVLFSLLALIFLLIVKRWERDVQRINPNTRKNGNTR